MPEFNNHMRHLTEKNVEAQREKEKGTSDSQKHLPKADFQEPNVKEA